MSKQSQKGAIVGGKYKVVEQWISVADVAVHLGVKRDTVYKWVERGQMPSHKVGRLWKFRISEIDRWVESGKAKVRSIE